MTASQFPLKSKPTNHDLQVQNHELHQCLHATDAKVGRAEAKIDVLALAMGVHFPTKEEAEQGSVPVIKSRVGNLKPWKVVLAVVPAVVGSLGLYRVLEPAVIAFFVELRNALLTVNL